MIENTTVTLFIEKIDYNITVTFENINGKTVIKKKLVHPLSKALF